MLMQTSTGGSIFVSKRVRLSNDQLRRTRAIQMYRMRLEGCSVPEIAAFFSFTRQTVYNEIRAIPDATKRRHQRHQRNGPHGEVA